MVSLSAEPRFRLTLEELTKQDVSKLHVLRSVSIDSVWHLLEGCPIVTFAQGEVLIEKGESNEIMYLLLEGRLTVHLDKREEEPVASLTCGETAGEISVIDHSPATAFVQAAETSRVLAVDEETFWNIAAVSHEFSTNLLLLLAARMRVNLSQICDNLFERQRLEREANVDVLTGLHNRRWLDENLNRSIQRHKFNNSPMSIIMLDIDRFKHFNDNFGHAAGDAVLAGVAKVIASKLRPTDLAARYGGEEFVVILPETPLDGALIAAERLRGEVAKPNIVNKERGDLPSVTVSLGVAELDCEESAEQLLKRADTALYAAKNNGRNRVESAK